ncbi:hypothetical protein CDAR_591521 [Caerostris darwini]|uniref:Uncharacterized protein n=1 Tax=Caerostris darwini TaxID=1538125 RepID=A0AAV4PKN5_9ARAC|nr:hypothetical protein CDAR_591521 [Caerostris darwini]
MQRFYEATFHMLERNSNPRKSIDLMRAVKVMQGKKRNQRVELLPSPPQKCRRGYKSKKSKSFAKRTGLDDVCSASRNSWRLCQPDKGGVLWILQLMSASQQFSSGLRLILIFVSEFPTLPRICDGVERFVIPFLIRGGIQRRTLLTTIY